MVVFGLEDGETFLEFGCSVLQLGFEHLVFEAEVVRLLDGGLVGLTEILEMAFLLLVEGF